MIAGFTEDNIDNTAHNIGGTSHYGTAIRPQANSIVSHSSISAIKSLQLETNGAEWDMPVYGFTKKRSYRMKWSLVPLVLMLFATPSILLAQNTPAPTTAPPAIDSAAPPAASQNPAANASTKDATDVAHYIIGPEDTLQVTVWKEPTLSGTVPVRPDGMISLVLLGDLRAAGMTPMQLSADITQRLKKYIQDPSVSVVVLSVNSQRIFVIGEVGHVGALALTAGMSPLQAIAAAGGLTPFANSKHIYILRGTGTNQKKIPFNYKNALKGESKQDVSLEPGDTIVVP